MDKKNTKFNISFKKKIIIGVIGVIAIVIFIMIAFTPSDKELARQRFEEAIEDFNNTYNDYLKLDKNSSMYEEKQEIEMRNLIKALNEANEQYQSVDNNKDMFEYAKENIRIRGVNDVVEYCNDATYHTGFDKSENKIVYDLQHRY